MIYKSARTQPKQVLSSFGVVYLQAMIFAGLQLRIYAVENGKSKKHVEMQQTIFPVIMTSGFSFPVHLLLC